MNYKPRAHAQHRRARTYYIWNVQNRQNLRLLNAPLTFYYCFLNFVYIEWRVNVFRRMYFLFFFTFFCCFRDGRTWNYRPCKQVGDGETHL